MLGFVCKLRCRFRVRMNIASTRPFEKRELSPLELGAMSYMMSKGAYLTDHDHHQLAYFIFYAPPLDSKAWGADLPKSPVMPNLQFKGGSGHRRVYRSGRWSDGSAAPVI